MFIFEFPGKERDNKEDGKSRGLERFPNRFKQFSKFSHVRVLLLYNLK
jgi:hypothetical protein